MKTSEFGENIIQNHSTCQAHTAHAFGTKRTELNNETKQKKIKHKRHTHKHTSSNMATIKIIKINNKNPNRRKKNVKKY